MLTFYLKDKNKQTKEKKKTNLPVYILHFFLKKQKQLYCETNLFNMNLHWTIAVYPQLNN